MRVEARGLQHSRTRLRCPASGAKGLKLATEDHDPVHLELLSLYAENVYDKAGIAGAIKAIEAARMLQPRGSPADTCLLITRGLLEHRQDREDLAIVTLTQAYRASIAPAVTEPHIMSADYSVAGHAQHGRLPPSPGPQPGEDRLGHRARGAR